jgi:hypothetical protein
VPILDSLLFIATHPARPSYPHKPGVLHYNEQLLLKPITMWRRCPGGAQQLIPLPIVSVQAAGTLQYNEQEWEQGWATQVSWQG